MYIELQGGRRVLIDDEDAHLAAVQWSWDGAYASRKVGAKKIYLHREVLQAPLVDHRNEDTLDCRRENLRAATRSQNGANRGANANNKSGYKGVSFDKRTGKWLAQLQVQGRKVWLGRFPTPETAHEAYATAAKREFGVVARA